MNFNKDIFNKIPLRTRSESEKKYSVLISMDVDLHKWAKQNIPNLSGFINNVLMDFSGSYKQHDNMNGENK